MASAHELARGRERLRALIEFALGEGWRVVRTSGGHLKFTKPAARRSTPARPRATTVPTAMPAPSFAAPTGRRRRRAVAELTPQDMAAKLLATGFERSGPSAAP
jgi:predicted RNA binding protein YcfA (HicA-like mRNA interferase family)